MVLTLEQKWRQTSQRLLNNTIIMKKRSERRKHCALAVVRRSQKYSPRRRPLPGGAGRPKFDQLEMVTTFTYRPSLVKIKHAISSYRGSSNSLYVALNCRACCNQQPVFLVGESPRYLNKFQAYGQLSSSSSSSVPKCPAVSPVQGITRATVDCIPQGERGQEKQRREISALNPRTPKSSSSVLRQQSESAHEIKRCRAGYAARSETPALTYCVNQLISRRAQSKRRVMDIQSVADCVRDKLTKLVNLMKQNEDFVNRFNPA